MEAQDVGAVIRAVLEWTGSAPQTHVLGAYFGICAVLVVLIVGGQKLWERLRNPGGAGRGRLTRDPRRGEAENKPTRRR